MAPADDYSETRTVSGRFTNGYGVDVTDSKGRKRRGVVSFDLNDLVRFQADGPIIEFKHFQWPMYAGRKWSYEYDSPGRVDGMTDVARNERRITTEAVEDVGVPAGRFAAVRVLVIGSYQVRYQGGTGAGTIEERHWYSPVTRSYLKSEITHRNNFANIMYLIRRELTAYKLASGGRTIG
jgi:hypothetical protein